MDNNNIEQQSFDFALQLKCILVKIVKTTKEKLNNNDSKR